MRLEKETARIVMFIDHDRPTWQSAVNLGVKINGKLYEIEQVVSPFTFGPVAVEDFVNITASFASYDLETVTK